MAAMNDEPWQESEKLFLLAEILKDAQVPVGVFLGIILDAQIEPRWEDIPLPAGRSLRSCQTAFQYLMSDPSLPMSASALRNAPSQPFLFGGAKPVNPRKRPLPAKDAGTPGARNLQPRPQGILSLNGSEQSPFQFSPEQDPTQPPKKKRGRPSKADLEARAAAAAARGEPYPDPSQSKGARTTPKGPASGGKAGKTSAQRGAGGQGQTGVMMTPSGAESSTPGTGSAPRPRRGRPTKAESAAKRILLEAAQAAGQGGDPGGSTASEGQHFLAGTMGDPATDVHDPFGTGKATHHAGPFEGGPGSGPGGVHEAFGDTSMHD